MTHRQLLSLIVPMLILCACGTPPATPPAAGSPPAATEYAPESAPLNPTPAAPTQAPTMQAPTTQPQPTLAPTAQPPAPSWYWVKDENAQTLIAVNQYGERQEWDMPPNDDPINLIGFPLNNGHMLMLNSGSPLRAYLLTPQEGVQAIQLPAGLNYQPDISQPSLQLAAANDRFLAFGYTDESSVGTPSGNTAERGPLLLVDLSTRTARLLDTRVHRSMYSSSNEPQAWAHLSADGRFVRYLQGDTQNLNLRELDLVSGDVRTVYAVARHTTSHALRSVQGDLWRFTRDDVVIDLNGNQMTFASDTRTFRPLRDGAALEFTYDCADNCEITLLSPFSGRSEQTYVLPWHTYGTFFDPLLFIPAADQNLIFTGRDINTYPVSPAILQSNPDITTADAPVFRLDPNGGARLVGLYIPKFSYDSASVSADGRYMLLGAVNHQSFYFYDTMQDSLIAEMPAQPELDYFWSVTTFLSHGRIAHFTASTPNNDYVDFHLIHSDYSGAAYVYENKQPGSCFDLLEDDTLVCTVYPDPQNYTVNLVLYQLTTGSTRILMENIIPLQLVK